MVAMSKSLTREESELLEVLSDKRVENATWSRAELINKESSWGGSDNPTETVDSLIKNGDLVKVGMNIFGKPTYRPKPKG